MDPSTYMNGLKQREFRKEMRSNEVYYAPAGGFS
jgi:hypothetical protein